MEKQFSVQSVKQLQPVINYMATLAKTNKYFCFDAKMGAGKTTLIKQLCIFLGVTDTISSPTYSIVNEYLGENNLTIYHFDLYRLNDEMELLDIGIEDMLESNAVCFIEWPEKILNFLPQSYVKVNIDVNNNQERIITVTLPS